MNIVELIDAIKGRPLFFLKTYSIYEFDSFIGGYNFYKHSHNFEKTKEDILFDEFKNNFLKDKLNMQDEVNYVEHLISTEKNSSKALDIFFRYWYEFNKINKVS